VVFRKVLFRVDKVLEVLGDELLELVERNERRLDMVGRVVRSGHPENECPSGVNGGWVQMCVRALELKELKGGGGGKTYTTCSRGRSAERPSIEESVRGVSRFLHG
jgi:hypothetical protein